MCSPLPLGQEKPANLFRCLDLGSPEVQFSPGQHLEAQVQVGEPSVHPGLIAQDDSQFVGSTVAPDGREDFPMKVQDFGCRHLDSFFQSQVPQGFHDGGHIDPIGTFRRTGGTAHADPDGARFQHLPALAELHQADNEVGPVIHGRDEGATSGAALAMKAAIEIGSAQSLQLPGEGTALNFDDAAFEAPRCLDGGGGGHGASPLLCMVKLICTIFKPSVKSEWVAQNRVNSPITDFIIIPLQLKNKGYTQNLFQVNPPKNQNMAGLI